MLIGWLPIVKLPNTPRIKPPCRFPPTRRLHHLVCTTDPPLRAPAQNNRESRRSLRPMQRRHPAVALTPRAARRRSTDKLRTRMRIHSPTALACCLLRRDYTASGFAASSTARASASARACCFFFSPCIASSNLRSSLSSSLLVRSAWVRRSR
jgi:hypothetical protein